MVRKRNRQRRKKKRKKGKSVATSRPSKMAPPPQLLLRRRRTGLVFCDVKTERKKFWCDFTTWSLYKRMPHFTATMALNAKTPCCSYQSPNQPLESTTW
jgi:hypothetical protein